ncbi:hypothetical protein ACFOLK_11325 [Marinococcus halophilus]|uniref:Uncharacterized protein n=1 Tax=Marinococcus halophilus TaxID=1371 RepID=A0A510Y1H6_MARHA|nr:hypothetical protein [Marinococcus halophilus]GEK57175.1 hypothetical protein MHA01_00800 [Marinococcus halophilus]
MVDEVIKIVGAIAVIIAAYKKILEIILLHKRLRKDRQKRKRPSRKRKGRKK